MANTKASRFKKREIQEAAIQSQVNLKALDQLRQIVQALSVTSIEQTQRVGVVTDLAKRANQRSLDLIYQVQALIELAGLSSESVDKRALALRESDTEKYNDEQDRAGGWIAANSDAKAESGMTAIVSIALYQNGKELVDDRIVKARIEIGKGELLAEIDQAILGLVVGESKRVTVKLGERTTDAEVKLLGLRAKAVANQEATRA